MVTFIVLVGLPILEIVVAAWVASWAGIGWMLLALVALSALGVVLLPRVGMGSFTRVRNEIARGQPPAVPILDQMLLLLAAVLLIVPGFITGVAGLLLLVPPLRHLAARRLGARFRGRVRIIQARTGPAGTGPIIDATSAEAPPPVRPQLDQP